jgi:MFS transporter, ACS family, tartrate transporter
VNIANRGALMRKLGWRLGGFLALANLFCGIDRFNVSIAALTMNGSLGLTATTFGAGVGAFFWTYVMGQVPVSLALRRYGVKRTIAAIMIAWGTCASAMGFVTDGASFIVVRAALGAAEAGFFPAVLFLTAQWIPESHRGRFLSMVTVAAIASTVVGPPLATNLMRLDRSLGLAGWRWVFILEGVPALILGLTACFVLSDRIPEARWLSAREKLWLMSAVSAGHHDVGSSRSRARDLLRTDVVLLALMWFTIEAGANTVAYWMPLVIKGAGLTNTEAGYTAALPGLVGCIAMILWARSSDRNGERRAHLAMAMVSGGSGLIATGFLLHGPVLATTALCVATAGLVSTTPILWSIPPRILPAPALPLAVAIISAIGNIGGFVAPLLMGVLVDMTHDFRAGLFLAGAPVMLAALATLFVRLRPVPGGSKLEQGTGPSECQQTSHTYIADESNTFDANT